MVETPSSTWTSIRVVDQVSWKGDVPSRYDVVTIILPRDGNESPRHRASDASPPISPVRLHVWTATFLT
ncbi:hypothetical protein CRI94_07020 [Longibacter salinarum]|uniref:Uncharacterized protein n=1 Tax=Longibacter salinarum TaxID=1850348 RepID=A0A2A8CYY5_9BACT|nr:hypothetical protein [Longibacter salinarum]PEN13811.1 hypothetical protein CRI94_07020 [Longibacter salinarum]